MKNEIYIGKYLQRLFDEAKGGVINLEETPLRGGVLELPISRIRVSNRYHGKDPVDGHEWTDPRITLVVEDREGDREGNFFWPYIGRMSKEEAQQLRDALDEVINFQETPQEDTIERYIG